MAALGSFLRLSRLPSHFSYGLLCILVTLSLGLWQKADLSFLALPMKIMRPSGAPSSAAQNDLATPSLPHTTQLQPQRLEKDHTFVSGQTLTSVLSQMGIPKTITHECLVALRKKFDPETFKAGQKINVVLEEGENSKNLLSLSFQPDLDTTVKVHRTSSGAWQAVKQAVVLKKETKLIQGKIHNSLCLDAQKHGVPQIILQKMIQLLSYEVDFQRDIKAGDHFSVIYQREYNEHTGQERPAGVLYAAIHLSGSPVQIYQFSHEKGQADFYNSKGESIRRGLLRTPVDGARLSSGFGMRSDPIHGFTKKHKGVDFAAPIGTPVMAAGDGVVEQAQYKGNYGNYILIRHNGEYKSAYAHLQRFHKNVRSGKRVRQGDVIGFIGVTGRTTGAHLHHEILHHGQHINPKKVKNFGAKRLTGAHLARFHAFKDSIHKQVQS